MSPVNELPIKGSQFYHAGSARSTDVRRSACSRPALQAGLAACSKPVEQIIPYVRMPERVVPGEG